MELKFIQTIKRFQLKTILIVSVFLLLPDALFAQCSASSVQICGVADDMMTLWIDGAMVGSGNDFQFANVNCIGT